MMEVEKFVGCLKDSSVEFFTGVPDSLLKSFCAHVTDRCGENEVVRYVGSPFLPHQWGRPF